MSNTAGMNWIRQEKRLAIYLRDGLACCYCGKGIENNIQLSLDHLKPRIKNGSHHESNLITCCIKCNSSRQDKKLNAFLKIIAISKNVSIEDIQKKIRNQTARKLPKQEAKKLIEIRGSAKKAIDHLK